MLWISGQSAQEYGKAVVILELSSVVFRSCYWKQPLCLDKNKKPNKKQNSVPNIDIMLMNFLFILQASYSFP